MATPYKSGAPSKQTPPSKPGEYKAVNKKTGEVKYVGTTNNLKRRIEEHKRSGDLTGLSRCDIKWKQADGRFSPEARYDHEKKTIERLNPQLNKRAGGGGRR